MTEPTPQAELSAAADKIRTLAEAATAGVCPDFVYWAVRHIARNCDIECGHDEHGMAPTWDRHDDSPYIAAMGPAVGAALAKWLRESNALHEEHRPGPLGVVPPGCQWCADEDWPCADMRAALALARAVNGAVQP